MPGSTQRSTSGAIDEFTVDTVQHAPAPKRERIPREPEIPWLNDEVWASYTTGDWKIIWASPEKEDYLRKQLFRAKNHVNWQHRDDEPQVDVRGLDREYVFTITDVADVPGYAQMDKDQQKRIKAKLDAGQVGVRFRAHPPMAKGPRAKRERLREQARTQVASRPASRSSRSATSRRATASEARAHTSADAVPPVPMPFRPKKG